MTRNQSVLAMDIGTRSIVGVILEQVDGETRVIAVDYLEHQTRSMYDGQIHDVATVASEIEVVKNRLEEKTGIVLKHAAVAAAGRALKTACGKAETTRRPNQEITLEEVRALELEAIQKAQDLVTGENTKGTSGYFCVGYSVIRNYIEDQPILNLVGQVGTSAAVEVIATFLPRVVVESLLSALRKSNLEISNLTLEPIAAITAAIPDGMRMLNLALVDIGAGTSDIAVVIKGTVTAYAMVPLGGDEVTEAIAEKYLLDFNTAENVKCQLRNNEMLEFTDILGNQNQVEAAEMQNEIKSIINELANRIAYEIMAINQKRPDAVVCVGGGSLTPNLLVSLAEALELPHNRVGIRTRESIARVKGEFANLTGPQAVTPVGIGLVAMEAQSLPLIKVKVNSREIPMWGLDEISVGSALLASGVNLSNILGRPGMGITLELNGKLKVFRGSMGTQPVIKVNDAIAHLDTPIKEGDSIEFVRGQDGQNAVVKVRDLVDTNWGTVFVDGNPLEIPPLVMVNGEEVDLDFVVPDRAQIEYIEGQSIAAILLRSGRDPNTLELGFYDYTLNGISSRLKWAPCQVEVNGTVCSMDAVGEYGVSIETQINNRGPVIKDILKLEEVIQYTSIVFNDEEIAVPDGELTLKMNGEDVSLEHPLENGASILLEVKKEDLILSDIFKVVRIAPNSAGKLVIRVNGESAGFTTPIKNRDKVDLYWEQI